MAVQVLTDAYVALNGGDISQYVKSVTLDVTSDELDASNFASAGYKVPVSGLRSGSVALTFNQDVAASAIDSIMWPLRFTTVSFEVRATSASVGASNPKYTGNVVVMGWTPLDGSVGDLSEVSVTYPTSGAVTRAVS